MERNAACIQINGRPVPASECITVDGRNARVVPMPGMGAELDRYYRERGLMHGDGVHDPREPYVQHQIDRRFAASGRIRAGW